MVTEVTSTMDTQLVLEDLKDWEAGMVVMEAMEEV